MKTFVFHWLDGKTETARGLTVSEAYAHLGYGAGALAALDYYETIDERGTRKASY